MEESEPKKEQSFPIFWVLVQPLTKNLCCFWLFLFGERFLRFFYETNSTSLTVRKRISPSRNGDLLSYRGQRRAEINRQTLTFLAHQIHHPGVLNRSRSS